MDIRALVDLMGRCEEAKFWGNVKLNFRDGELVLVEMIQTLRPQEASANGNANLVVFEVKQK